MTLVRINDSSIKFLSQYFFVYFLNKTKRHCNIVVLVFLKTLYVILVYLNVYPPHYLIHNSIQGIKIYLELLFIVS